MLDDYSHGLTVPKVGIYSLASGFWRKNLASAPVCTLCFVGRDAPYGFVHGLVHWGAKRRVNNDDPHAWYHFVLSYSFEDEVFGEVLLPETLAHVSSYAVTVTVVGGNRNGKGLPLTVYRVSGGLPSYGDIWVMKEYGVVGSWTKVFSFDLRGFWLEAPSLGITVTGVTAPPSAMCVRNGGEVLLLMDVAGKGCLYSLDVERKTFTDLGIGGEGYTWYLYSGYYTETLVLLNDNVSMRSLLVSY